MMLPHILTLTAGQRFLKRLACLVGHVGTAAAMNSNLMTLWEKPSLFRFDRHPGLTKRQNLR
jgi:hypothetical protein